MKKITLAILLFAAVAVNAQTNSAPSFFGSVQNYFTSFDTNSTTFLADNVDIWAGADTVDSSTTRASLGIAAMVYQHKLSIESITRSGAVGGTVVSQQFGVGYNITHFDTRFTGYIHAGYSLDSKRAYAAPGLRVMKALTANTYAGMSLELPFYFKRGAGVTPTISVFTGFRF